MYERPEAFSYTQSDAFGEPLLCTVYMHKCYMVAAWHRQFESVNVFRGTFHSMN